MTLKTLVDIQIEIDANEPILRSRPLGKSQSLNKALTLFDFMSYVDADSMITLIARKSVLEKTQI